MTIPQYSDICLEIQLLCPKDEVYPPKKKERMGDRCCKIHLLETCHFFDPKIKIPPLSY